MSKNKDWFTPINQENSSYIRLFCFHYAGGSASSYTKWAKDIIKDVELIAIQLPGRENRFGEPLLTNITQVVDQLYSNFEDYLEKPFVFFGHSIGALIAFEFTRMLRRKGVAQPNHLIISGTESPQGLLKRTLLHNLSDSQLIQEICKYNSIPNEILNDQELMCVFLPIIRADFRISETYQYNTEEPLNCPITALGGSNDNSFGLADLLEWQKQTNFLFKYKLLPGDHFFIRSSYQEVIQIINKILHQEITQLGSVKF